MAKPAGRSSASPVIANTFLIGAQKAGTTFLASILDQSPEICVSDPKEPQFFTTRFEEGFEAYARCFRAPQAPVRLDASTTYSFLRPGRDLHDAAAPGLSAPVPERIAAAAPEARFIYILRDPVKRAASAHKHNLRRGGLRDPRVSLVAACEADPMLVVAGRYADQIERYLEVFPRERFLFLDFRRLVSDPGALVSEVCDFLGVSAAGIDPARSEDDMHRAYQWTRLGALSLRLRRAAPALVRGVKKLVPRRLKAEVLAPALRAPVSVEFFDEAAAAKFFEEDRARVRALTGLDI